MVPHVACSALGDLSLTKPLPWGCVYDHLMKTAHPLTLPLIGCIWNSFI